MEPDTTVLSPAADVVGPAVRAPEARDAGRRCSHPDCDTKLSRYNPDDACNAHGGWSDATVKRPGRKPSRPDVERPPSTTAAREEAGAADLLDDRVIDLRDGTASDGPAVPGRTPPEIVIDPAVTLEGADGSAHVVAELSLEPTLDSVSMPRLMRRVTNLLARTDLDVVASSDGMVIRGDMATIMDAVEQIHRLSSRQRSHVVTSVRVIASHDEP